MKQTSLPENNGFRRGRFYGRPWTLEQRDIIDPGFYVRYNVEVPVRNRIRPVRAGVRNAVISFLRTQQP